MTHSIIVTITGPSASGKTVLSNLLNDDNKHFQSLVSSTTRAKRRGEVDGRDYHFLSKEDFLHKLDNHEFIENIEYNHTFYGVSVEEAQKCFTSNKCAVLVAEPHGVKQINDYAHKKGWQVLKVFVDNPKEVLLERLLNRLAMDVECIDKKGKPISEDNRLSHEQLLPYIKRIKNLLDHNIQGEDLRDLKNDKRLKKELIYFVNSINPTPVNLNKIHPRLESAMLRLSSFQFEQDNWVKNANKNPQAYDVVVSKFNNHVQDSVVKMIKDKIFKLEKVNSIAKKPQSFKI